MSGIGIPSYITHVLHITRYSSHASDIPIAPWSLRRRLEFFTRPANPEDTVSYHGFNPFSRMYFGIGRAI